MGLEFPKLEIILNQIIYEDESPINFIKIDPINLILIGSKKSNEIVGLRVIDKKFHYFYI